MGCLMDVEIEVSLAGGHKIEFVCDENDPLVFGLVSALPGVAIDADLPPDGLIQIEKRSGERVYMVRSSLVAVAVKPMEGTLGDGSRAEPKTRAAPALTVFKGVFTEETLAVLRNLADQNPATGELDGFEPSSAAFSRDMIDFVKRAAPQFLAADIAAHLDLRFALLDADGSTAFGQEHTGNPRLICAVALEPLAAAQVCLTAQEQTASTATLPIITSRTIQLDDNSGAFLPAGAHISPVTIVNGASESKVLVIMGAVGRAS